MSRVAGFCIGFCVSRAPGIEPVDEHAHEFIEQAALAWFAGYRARVAAGEIVHQPRGDARIRQGAYTAAA